MEAIILECYCVLYAKIFYKEDNMVGIIISPIIGGARLMTEAKDKWIGKALKKRKTKKGPRGEGTLTAQAAKHGMTPGEFCASSMGKKGIGAKRCQMRRNLMKSAK